MVRHASLFSQLVALFNRGQFHNLVFRHKAERFAKAFVTKQGPRKAATARTGSFGNPPER